MNSYEKDCKLDIMNLDNHWLEQPMLVIKYGELYVNAEAERNKAKDQLELVKAELDSLIRGNPSTWGIEKVTEGAIQATLIQHPDYQLANQALQKSINDLNLIKIARDAVMNDRKEALRGLTQLYVSGYFASSDLPKSITSQQKELDKTACTMRGKKLIKTGE